MYVVYYKCLVLLCVGTVCVFCMLCIIDVMYCDVLVLYVCVAQYVSLYYEYLALWCFLHCDVFVLLCILYYAPLVL